MATVDETLAKLSNPTVEAYLDLMRDTETPPIFHAWSLISAASSCLTRRRCFKMGPITIYPNQFVLLVGAPGVRKTEGVKFIRKMLDDVHGLRFSPNNTAGRLQGLLAAMSGKRPAEADADDAIAEAMSGLKLDLGPDLADEELDQTHVLNRHAIYVAEGELVSFIGRNMDEFINFLGDIWDNKDEYSYQLKRELVKLSNPCINILGAMTPSHIINYLPPQAIGQGFTSRTLMIYAEDGKKIPWPDEIDEPKFNQFKQLMRWIFDMPEGTFGYTAEAKKAVVDLYSYKIAIEDVRFLHYAQRRQTHLIKVAMALAALRMSDVVSGADISDAHVLLTLAESKMPECLGEYGLSPAGLARSRVIDVIKHASEPLTVHRIMLAVGSDVQRTEVSRALYEMASSNQIVELHLKDPAGAVKVGYVWPRETNPFRKHEEVRVDYLINEGAKGMEKRAGASIERATSMLSAKQDAPDLSTIPDPSDEVAVVADLAAQGFSSAAEKLQAFIAKRQK